MTSYELYAEIRTAKGLKDSDICKMAGISSGTMSDWKKGRYELKTDKMEKIADALGVSLDTLTGRTTYYYDAETAEMADYLFKNKEMRILFDAARGSSPQNLQLAAEMLKRFKETNNDG